jgi:hypothetical protein
MVHEANDWVTLSQATMVVLGAGEMLDVCDTNSGQNKLASSVSFCIIPLSYPKNESNCLDALPAFHHLNPKEVPFLLVRTHVKLRAPSALPRSNPFSLYRAKNWLRV